MHHGIGHMVGANPLDIHTPSLVTSGDHHWRPVQTCSLEDIPPSPHTLLTPTGGHRIGGMHPAGMLSCLPVVLETDIKLYKDSQ